VEATPEQVLEGLLVGFSDQLAMCTVCYADLQEGMTVTAYAHRCASAAEWSIPRVYCADCAPDRLSSPTLGFTEVLATAELGMRSFHSEQSHWLCLNDVEIAVHSPPTEGSEP